MRAYSEFEQVFERDGGKREGISKRRLRLEPTQEFESSPYVKTGRLILSLKTFLILQFHNPVREERTWKRLRMKHKNIVQTV